MTTAGDDSTDRGREPSRAEWLATHGPHALVRSVRSGGDWLVFSLTVRPGTPTNTVAKVTLRLTGPDGGELTVPIQVFDSYHRQWSLDLTTGVRSSALGATGPWTGSVVLTDSDGEHVLPLRSGEATAFSLIDLPDLAASTGAWTLEPGQPPQRGRDA